MGEISLSARPVLGGASLEIGENRIVERGDLALVSVAPPLGDENALAGTLKTAWDLDLPAPTVSTASGEMRALRLTAEQLLLLFPRETPDAEPYVRAALGGTGYTTDQTGAWVVLDVSGPDTLAALERLCPLDLDEGVFPLGGYARTSMEHLGVALVRLAQDRFLLMSASSSAGSFLHAVEVSYRWVTD